MFEPITNTFHAIYKYVVSCFRKKNQPNISENEYGRLPDYEPVTKINIQIPKYQFILLEDD